jgi:enterochelin esterase-like enzyme
MPAPTASAPTTQPPQPPSAPTAAAAVAPCGETAGAIHHTTVSSTVYGAPVAVSVYLPPCYTVVRDPFPVIYLLHGSNADETQWPDLRVQPDADALIGRGTTPFVVVMPGGDYRTKLDYAAFVLNDLLPGMAQQFRVSTARSGRAIGGISFGGYWALKLAFSHPDLFAAAGGHSPLVDRGQPDDPLALARTADGLGQLRVTLDVGDADALRANTARLAQALHDHSVTVAFAVHPGRHDRTYWRSQTAAYLEFYLNAITHIALPIQRSAQTSVAKPGRINKQFHIMVAYGSTPSSPYSCPDAASRSGTSCYRRGSPPRSPSRRHPPPATIPHPGSAG